MYEYYTESNPPTSRFRGTNQLYPQALDDVGYIHNWDATMSENVCISPRLSQASHQSNVGPALVCEEEPPLGPGSPGGDESSLASQSSTPIDPLIPPPEQPQFTRRPYSYRKRPLSANYASKSTRGARVGKTNIPSSVSGKGPSTTSTSKSVEHGDPSGFRSSYHVWDTTQNQRAAFEDARQHPNFTEGLPLTFYNSSTPNYHPNAAASKKPRLTISNPQHAYLGESQPLQEASHERPLDPMGFRMDPAFTHDGSHPEGQMAQNYFFPPIPHTEHGFPPAETNNQLVAPAGHHPSILGAQAQTSGGSKGYHRKLKAFDGHPNHKPMDPMAFQQQMNAPSLLTPNSLCSTPYQDSLMESVRQLESNGESIAGIVSPTSSKYAASGKPLKGVMRSSITSPPANVGSFANSQLSLEVLGATARNSSRDTSLKTESEESSAALVVEHDKNASNSDQFAISLRHAAAFDNYHGLSLNQAAYFERIFSKQLEMLYRTVADEFNDKFKSVQIGIEFVLGYMHTMDPAEFDMIYQ